LKAGVGEGWRWKLRAIEEMNPEWDDLSESMFLALGTGLRRCDDKIAAPPATAGAQTGRILEIEVRD
jgi:hypothetical protein